MRWLLLVAVSACSHTEAPPCTPEDYALLAATCGDDEAKCDERISDRESFCAERIRRGE